MIELREDFNQIVGEYEIQIDEKNSVYRLYRNWRREREKNWTSLKPSFKDRIFGRNGMKEVAVLVDRLDFKSRLYVFQDIVAVCVDFYPHSNPSKEGYWIDHVGLYGKEYPVNECLRYILDKGISMEKILTSEELQQLNAYAFVLALRS